MITKFKHPILSLRLQVPTFSEGIETHMTTRVLRSGVYHPRNTPWAGRFRAFGVAILDEATEAGETNGRDLQTDLL